MHRSLPLAMLLVLGSPLVGAADEKPKEMTTRELVAKTKNAIVRINVIAIVEQEVMKGSGKDAKAEKVEKDVAPGGTGFVVAGGYIVTNNHVLEVPLQLGQKVKRVLGFRGTLAFDTSAPPPLRPPGKDNGPNPFLPGPVAPEDLTRHVVWLKVVNRDPLSDLAVLRVESVEGDRLNGRLKHVEGELERAALAFAPHTETQVGDDVVAVGFPRLYAGAPTVTKGIVSALNRGLPGSDAFTDLLQTDAAINPGNSGGPLLDMHGRIVGVNTYSFNHLGTPGVGFARSARTTEPFVKMLQKGPIKRAGLGFAAVPIGTDDAEGLLGAAPGILLTEIAKGSPAEKAGARPGDLIVRIGGESVSRAGDLNNALALVAGRDSVSVTVWRFPEADVKFLLAVGIDDTGRLKLGRIYQPEGAVKKHELTMKLK